MMYSSQATVVRARFSTSHSSHRFVTPALLDSSGRSGWFYCEPLFSRRSCLFRVFFFGTCGQGAKLSIALTFLRRQTDHSAWSRRRGNANTWMAPARR